MKIYQAKMPDDAQFWDGRFLVTKDANVFVANSIRNLGKSTVGRRLIFKAMKEGHNAIWSRWSSTELSIAESAIVDRSEIQTKENPDGKYIRQVLNSRTFWYLEDVETGGRLYFIAIKASNTMKGIDIPDVKEWVYDEYIPEIYDNRTRRIEEASRFFSMYQTVARLNKNFRTYLFANCITWFTSYNVAWGVKPFPANQIRTYRQLLPIPGTDGKEVAELRIAYENVGVTPAMRQRITANEAIRGAALPSGYFDNQTGDNLAFVETCPSPNAPMCPSEWVLAGKTYTYRVYDDKLYWFESKPRAGAYRYTTSKDDVALDVIRDRTFGPVFDDLFDAGRLRFANGHVQEAVITMIWEASKSTYRC